MLTPSKEFFRYSCSVLVIAVKLFRYRNKLPNSTFPSKLEYEYFFARHSLDTYHATDYGLLTPKEAVCAVNDTYMNLCNMPEYDTLFTDEPFVVVDFFKSLKDTSVLIDTDSHPYLPKGLKGIFDTFNKEVEDYINGVIKTCPDLVFINLFSKLIGTAVRTIEHPAEHLPTQAVNVLASGAMEWYPKYTVLIEELLTVVEEKVELARSNPVVSKLDNLLLLKWTKEACDMFTDISDSMELNVPLVEDFDRRTVESWKEINPGLLQEAIDTPALQIRQIGQNQFLVAFLYPDDTVECKVIDFTNTKLSGKQFSCTGSGRYEHPFTPEAKVVVELNVTIV